MAFSLVLPYFADILPPSAVFRHTVRLLPVFYILHGTAGVYVGVFRDGFSVEQHHRGVAEKL